MYQHLSFAMFRLFHHISRHSSVLDTLCEFLILSFSMFIGSSNPDRNNNIWFFPFQLNKLKKNWKSIDLRRFLAFGSRHATAWLQSRETLSTFIHDILLCNIHTQSRAQQFPNYENLCISRDYSGFSTFLFRYRKMLNIVMSFRFLRSNENGKQYSET